VAPVRPETREILMQDLVNVEAIPYDVMKAGIDWQWESYGQYLAAVGRGGLGINVAGLVAFTPLRHYVMGEASFERAATADEIAGMRRLLREAMEARATGGRVRGGAPAARESHGGGPFRLPPPPLAHPRGVPGPPAGLPQCEP